MINAEEAKKITSVKREEYKQKAFTNLMDLAETRIKENSNSGFYSCSLRVTTPNILENSEYEEIILNVIHTLIEFGYFVTHTVLPSASYDTNTYSIIIKWE